VIIFIFEKEWKFYYPRIEFYYPRNIIWSSGATAPAKRRVLANFPSRCLAFPVPKVSKHPRFRQLAAPSKFVCIAHLFAVEKKNSWQTRSDADLDFPQLYRAWRLRNTGNRKLFRHAVEKMVATKKAKLSNLFIARRVWFAVDIPFMTKANYTESQQSFISWLGLHAVKLNTGIFYPLKRKYDVSSKAWNVLRYEEFRDVKRKKKDANQVTRTFDEFNGDYSVLQNC